MIRTYRTWCGFCIGNIGIVEGLAGDQVYDIICPASVRSVGNGVPELPIIAVTSGIVTAGAGTGFTPITASPVAVHPYTSVAVSVYTLLAATLLTVVVAAVGIGQSCSRRPGIGHIGYVMLHQL